jgi:hypothetical protein
LAGCHAVIKICFASFPFFSSFPSSFLFILSPSLHYQPHLQDPFLDLGSSLTLPLPPSSLPVNSYLTFTMAGGKCSFFLCSSLHPLFAPGPRAPLGGQLRIARQRSFSAEDSTASIRSFGSFEGSAVTADGGHASCLFQPASFYQDKAPS